MGMVKPYSDDEIELIKRLYFEGYSASQIAKQLGTGRSRNAVIGWIDRHINRNSHSVRRQKSTRVARLRIVTGPRIKAAPFEKRHIPATAPAPLNIKLEDLKRLQCRYSCNDPERNEEHLFCGHVARIGKAYCDFHYALCYVAEPAQSRRRKRADILAQAGM